MKLLLADSGLGVNVGMENLADKSLIHISSWGSVKMHRLLQEMGKKVNRLEKPKNREFLEDSQDICDVLNKGIGTEKVLSISLGTGEVDELYLHENAFRGMRNLRFLKIYSSCRFDTKKLHIPKLKILDWYEYPMRCLPSKFRPENLVKLKMQNSKLETLWEGVVALPCLKVMDLRKSYDLIEMPDLSKATNLETLNLWDCYSLVKFPSSIPYPNKLKELNMMNCRNLETIPIGISLKSLEVLNLYGCSRLRTFPQISTNILNLSVDGTGIEEFPSNLHLKKLSYLNMQNLKSKKLWERVQPLTLLTAMLSPSLESLRLSDIPTLVEIPCSFQNLHQLENLKITNCVNLESLPTGINLQSLRDLDLSGCSRLRTFPDISTNIGRLYLSETGIEEVPCWIEKFSRLRIIYMNGCINLETLPTGINLPSLKRVDLSGCSRLRTFPDISTAVEMLDLSETAIEEVPCWIGKFSSLLYLEMKGCINLETLPTGINLPSLYVLDLSGCSRLRTFPDISTNIWTLHLSETVIEEVPCWIEKFSWLELLSMNGCSKLKFVSLNISKLKRLGRVELSDCLNLDQEALKTYSDCLLRLSGEEVPSYFTHRTTITSSSSFSLTAPLLPSSLSQPFLGFRACIVHTWDNMSKIDAKPSLTGRFWNSSDSYVQEQDFRAEWFMSERVMDSHMLILGYRIPLSRYSNILAQMNYTHIDLQLDIKNHSPSEYKEWGIRLCSSADNPLGNPNTLPHVLEADEGSMLNEAGVGGGNDVVTERSSKRIRIS
ncbi:hypothetical protein HA466_0205820 [Hirschfeldia incana]|nr:hypothetical protein HA466_0205820 [Hirschfeldia incana]